jgi:hypothetical protein
MAETRAPERALDHVVVLLFENRSFDNVLGRLSGPSDNKIFEGVVGKELSNPIPSGPSTVPIARWSPTASPQIGRRYSAASSGRHPAARRRMCGQGRNPPNGARRTLQQRLSG